MIYVIVELRECTDKRREIANALSAGDWYFSSISALADMDQHNTFILEQLTQEDYVAGNFNLLGVVKLGDEGLVTSYA